MPISRQCLVVVPSPLPHVIDAHPESGLMRELAFEPRTGERWVTLGDLCEPAWEPDAFFPPGEPIPTRLFPEDETVVVDKKEGCEWVLHHRTGTFAVRR